METVVNDNNTVLAQYGWHYYPNSGNLTTSCDWTDITRYPLNITEPHDGAPGDYSYVHNSTGFSVLPAGCFSDSSPAFAYAGPVGPDVNASNYPDNPAGQDEFTGDLLTNTAFWTSDQSDIGTAWTRYMVYTYAGVRTYNYKKTYGYSVRCVRD